LADKPSRFLLASLHVDSLVSKKTTTRLKSALNSLFNGSGALEDAYDKVIERIDGQVHDDSTLAKSVLSWISYAQRPLTTEELCHALAVDTGDEDLDPENIPDVEDILSVCAGLVTVDEESQIIRLVHYTTQEYLEGIRENWHPRAQQEIASTCLTYLCFEPFKSSPCANEDELESRRKKYSFLDYSAWHWPEHVAAVQEEVCELAMALLQDDVLLASAEMDSLGWSFQVTHRWQMTGLHLTASFGLLHLSKELLSWAKKEKIDLANSKDIFGATPMFCAVENGHKEIVELLLSTGEVDVNAQDQHGWTVLIKAVKGGHKDIVELLLSIRKIDVNVQNEYMRTVLIEAVERGNKEIVKLLLGTGEVDVNAQDQYGWTVLIEAVERGYIEIVELLLSTGKVDVDVKVRGWTPLSLAASQGHREIVQLLLGTGKVNVNAQDERGWTVLMEAVERGYKEIVELLLSTGKVDVDVKVYEWTSLLLAVSQGHKEIVELLLGTGKVDVNAQDLYGWTVLIEAVERGYKEIVELLLNTGKVNVNVKAHGWTPLLLAAREGYGEIVELLLELGQADVDKTPDKAAVLMYAVDNGYEDFVECLLGISTDTGRMADRWPLLALIAAKRQRGIAELLGSEEVNLNTREHFDDVPLVMHAVESGHASLVELLLGAGADVHAKDKEGSTALMWAEKEGLVDMVDVLRAHISRL
jgi:ankyrin repeat protein